MTAEYPPHTVLWVVTAGSGLNGHWVERIFAHEPTVADLAEVEREAVPAGTMSPTGWEGLYVTAMVDQGDGVWHQRE
jgi:hypothetical protein